jgi:uncharacterized protein Smg (DUF494 family)
MADLLCSLSFACDELRRKLLSVGHEVDDSEAFLHVVNALRDQPDLMARFTNSASSISFVMLYTSDDADKLGQRIGRQMVNIDRWPRLRPSLT